MIRVLVIGERPEEAKAMAFRLGLYGFEATPSAGDLTLALRALFAFKPDVVVLDTGMQKGTRELFRLLEKVAAIPVFVLGDGAQAGDLVWYLEEGAADYLIKPVSHTLLAARLNAVLRRSHDNGRGVLAMSDLEIDLDRHQVRKNGAAVALTPTEFRLLQTLAENAGRACSHRMLLERVWGDDFRTCAHYLRLYMGYLRQKLEDDPRNPSLLLTEWGVGYRLAAEHARTALPAARSVKAAWA